MAFPLLFNFCELNYTLSAGLAIPRYIDMQEEARGAQVIANLRTIESAATLYATKSGSLPRRISPTDTSGDYNADPLVPNYLTSWPQSR